MSDNEQWEPYYEVQWENEYGSYHNKCEFIDECSDDHFKTYLEAEKWIHKYLKKEIKDEWIQIAIVHHKYEYGMMDMMMYKYTGDILPHKKFIKKNK